MRAAQKAGINATMGAAVVHAKGHHNWQNRTGVLEGGIDVVDYAREDGSGVVGTWGVRDVIYALIHELGGVITPKTAKALKIPLPDGSFRFVKSVRIPAGLTSGPRQTRYPSLAGRIRRAYDNQDAGAMADAADPIGALVAVLKADAGVAAQSAIACSAASFRRRGSAHAAQGPGRRAVRRRLPDRRDSYAGRYGPRRPVRLRRDREARRAR
jgi:hypothetical protein